MEFFYFDQLYLILGGNALYYLGIYGYGADITDDSQRATRYRHLFVLKYGKATVVIATVI